jgi:hypothetical protein
LTDYNPFRPRTIGVEWPAGQDRSTQLANSYGRAAQIDALTTNDIDAIQLGLRTRAGWWLDSRTALYALDLYESTNVRPGQLATAYSVPASLVTHSGGWLTIPAGGDLVSTVNEWPGDPQGTPGSDAAIFVNDPSTNPTPNTGWIRWKASTTFRDAATNAVVDLSDKRIINYEIRGWLGAFNPTGWNVTARGIHNTTGEGGDVALLENSAWEGGQIPVSTAGVSQPMLKYFTTGGTSQVRGNQDLRPADVMSMTSSGPGYFGLWAAYILPGGVGSYPFGFFVWSVALVVTYGIEKRLAVGYGRGSRLDNPMYAGDWVNFPLQHPTTGAVTNLGNPVVVTKTAGKKYTIVARTVRGTLPGNEWRSLDAGTTAGFESQLLPHGHIGFDVPFQGTPDWPGVPTDSYFQAPNGRVGSYVLVRNGAAVPDGSQSYLRYIEAQVWNGGSPWRFVAPGFIDCKGIEQEVEGATTDDDYGVLSVVVRNHSYMNQINAPLVLTLLDGATVLATDQITFADLRVSKQGDGKWYMVRKRLLSGVTLTAGKRYIVRATSTTSFVAWHVLVVAADGGNADLAAQCTYGGTATNAAVIDPAVPVTGKVDQLGWDALLRASTIPDPPANVIAFAEFVDVSHGREGSCAVASIARARITWDASTDPFFSYFEIERSVDAGDTWLVISQPRTNSFIDVEAPYNAPVRYRLRQYRVDGIWSDPTVASPVDLTVPLDDWVLVLSTNTDPNLMVACFDQPGYEWAPIDGERVEIRYFQGRDYGLALRESETRGESFQRELIIGFSEKGGRQLFDPLLAIAHNRDAPYILVRDHRGRRWYTAPQVVSLLENEPGGQYLATVVFNEVSVPFFSQYASLQG